MKLIIILFAAAFATSLIPNDFKPNINVNHSIDVIGPEYGKYCGYKVTDKYGSEPIDILDRACQFHDICVTALGMLNCFCNEQLYYLVSNIRPQTQKMSSAKDSILSWIYKSIMLCNTNYYWFDSLFALAPYTKDSSPYSYIPFYPSDEERSFIVETSDNAIIIQFNDTETYRRFALKMGNFERIHPGEFNWYPIKNATLVNVSPGESFVVFNPQPFELTAFINKVCI